jgi:signal transduction histidine kinase
VADIHEGIDSTLTLLHAQMGERITVVKEYGDVDPIYCSPSQLNQAFMHVIKNAAQSIAGEGEITIRTAVDGDHVRIQIADTGAGISPKQLEHIFDVGFGATDTRVKMKLGLSTTYNIMQSHGGEIKVTSEVGKGTEVTMTLPQKANSS